MRGEFSLNSVNVAFLPKVLKVKDYFDLSYTNIKRLPEDITAEYILTLDFSEMEEIPVRLKVGGNLFLENTPLSKKYSKEEIRKMIEDRGGYVKGDIYV